MITKTGAFPAATTKVNDKIFLEDNGSGDVTADLYKITVRADDNTITIATDCRSGGSEATDVKCTLHDGTVTLPWATTQHALDYTTRDSSNGDQINIKSDQDIGDQPTIDDILTAILNLSTYGTPTQTAGLHFKGYKTAADDGGIGGISGGGSFGIFGGDAADNMRFTDLHLHNCGSADIISLDNTILFQNCEIDNTTGNGLDLDLDARVIDCYIHNIGGNGIVAGVRSYILHNYLANGTNKFGTAIIAGGAIHDNIVNLSGSGNSSAGIRYIDLTDVRNNSIWCDAGSGVGIGVSGTSKELVNVMNNIVEGFTSGTGITSSADDSFSLYGGNASYNNGTHYSISGLVFTNLGDNEILGASAFTAPASADFTVGTSVRATAIPLTYKGASTDQARTRGLRSGWRPAVAAADSSPIQAWREGCAHEVQLRQGQDLRNSGGVHSGFEFDDRGGAGESDPVLVDHRWLRARGRAGRRAGGG